MKAQNFIPQNLPLSNTVYDINIYAGKLIKASTLLNALGHTIGHSKISSEIFMLPLLNQEAASSTRIEGTQVTIDDIYEAQNSDSEKNINNQEALNYIDAIDYGKECIQERGYISKRLLKEMHAILMSNGVRGEKKKPGEFKKTENYIGKKGSKREHADFIPPGPEHTEALIDNLVDYINSEVDDDKILFKTAVIHAQFETIHPFLDGNGRIGRVLIPLFLYYKKEIDSPIFFISKSLEKNQFQYYQNLNATRWNQNWNQWIEFFQENTIRQCEDTISLVRETEQLLKEDLELLKSQHNHYQIEKYIVAVYSSPIFTLKKICDQTGISYQSCRSYTNTLLQENRIFSNNTKRNTRFYNYRFLDKLR